jgi:uncharacterized protein YxeA
LADEIVNSSMFKSCNFTKNILKRTSGNQNAYIKEQTTQWRKEKVQKEKQRSTKHTYQAKGRVTRVPLKIEVNAGALEGSVDPAAQVLI